MSGPLLPSWFLELFEEICKRFPSWPCTTDTIVAFWKSLRDLEPRDIVRGVLEFLQVSKFPPTVGELRERALPAVDIELAIVDAFDEIRRNRAVASLMRFETREERLQELRARIVWSSESVRRAAEAVSWRTEWSPSQAPTIRAQFGRYLRALLVKERREAESLAVLGSVPSFLQLCESTTATT